MVVVAVFVLIARAEDQLRSWLPHWAAGSLEAGAVPLLVFAVFALVLGGSVRIAIVFLLATVFNVLFRLDFKSMRSPSPKPPAPRDRQSPVVLERASTEDWLPRVRATFLLAVIGSALLFAFLGGNLRADSRDRYMVRADSRTTVLLAMYAGGKGVCADFAPSTRILGNARDFITVAPDAGHRFKWVSTGRLVWPGGFRAFGWLESLQR